MKARRLSGTEIGLLGLAALAVLIAPPPITLAEQPPLRLTGAAFTGGARDRFGGVQHGEQVNYVYARSTGPASTMRAVFTLERLPAGAMSLHVKGRSDDGSTNCAVKLSLNGRVLSDGPNGFRADDWQVRKIAIPESLLRAGTNELVIANQEEEGRPGMPPWFMIAWCAIAPEEYTWRPDITRNFFVTLPDAVRPLPESLPANAKPGFAIRGIKGWMWRPEQYLAEIPILARYKMNFMMNCYTSMCDVEHYAWGDPRVNRWWEDLPAEKMRAYEGVVRACQQMHVQFCFSMNPNLCAKRIVDYNSAEDVNLLWKHYAWMQGLGVKWFNISLDDISQGIDAAGQAKVVNEIFQRLRAVDPEAQMVFCPTYYWGNGTGAEQKPYLDVLAQSLHADIYLFWTGDEVVGRITRKAAESFRQIARHRMVLWDNYPVNDNNPTMHLAPVTGRDADLCEVIEGYMSNSMCKQNEANRIPLLTCADYAFNPRAYDPARSIGQAIMHMGETVEQRVALKDLVEAYQGMLVHGQGTSFNLVRHQCGVLASLPHSRHVVHAYVSHLEDLADRMERLFPDRFEAARKTLRDDITWVKRTHALTLLGPKE